MTTIAWDGKTLAADRRATDSEGQIKTVSKLRRAADGRLLAAAGSVCRCGVLLDWLADPQSGARPAFQDVSEDYVDGIEILLTGVARLHQRFGYVDILDPFTAIGSGSGIALGAMAAGKTAAEAVEIAARFDSGTGNGIDVLELL